MHRVVIVALVACSAPPAPVRAPVPEPIAQPVKSESAEAEPWRPAPAPAPRPSREEVILRGPSLQRRFGTVEEQSKRSDLWDPCVRHVLQDRDPATRDALGDALTGYTVTCDRAARRIEFEPAAAKGQQVEPAVIGLRGVLTGARTEVALRVVYGVERPDPFERITILAGPLRWTSPRLDVDHVRVDQEAAAIPFAPSLARVVRRMLDEPDASIRFETASGYDEVILTDETKQDIRVLLDALNI